MELTKNEFKVKYENLFMDYKELLDKCLKNKLSPTSSQIPLEKHPEIAISTNYYLNNVGEIFINKENKTCIQYINGFKGLKANFQELLFDNVGKYACFAYKKIKEKNRFLEEKMKVLEENQREFAEYHMGIYKETLKIQEKLRKYQGKFKTLKNYKGISDEDLKDAIINLGNQLELAQKEQIHRLYRRQISQLKSQLNLENSPEFQKKPENAGFSLSLTQEKEKVSEVLMKNLQNTMNSDITIYDFEDLETNFLNNPLDLSYIFEKKPPVELQKSPIHQKSPIQQKSPMISLQNRQIENPPKEKLEKTPREKPMDSESVLGRHKKTKSLLPAKPKLNSIKKSTKRPVSVEKPQNLPITSRRPEEKSQDLMKLKDLIEDKKILTETFVLNHPQPVFEDSGEKFEKKSLANFKEDAENLKIFVRKVSNTVHENMDGIQNKMSKCQIADFFSEQDFFSNNEEFRHENLGEEGERIYGDSNTQISILNLTEDLEGKMKKRRSRNDRNGSRKMD